MTPMGLCLNGVRTSEYYIESVLCVYIDGSVLECLCCILYWSEGAKFRRNIEYISFVYVYAFFALCV